MKKCVQIFLLLFFIAPLFAQSVSNSVKGKVHKQDDAAMKKMRNAPLPADGGLTVKTSPYKTIIKPGEKAEKVGEIIGYSTYDLQSNASVRRGVAMGPDGTLHAVWTRSATLSDPSFPDRGTGYNTIASNGTVGVPLPERIESQRTGWPEIGVMESGRLVVISHYASASPDNGLSLSYKDPGDTDWNHILDFPISNNQDLWPRMAVSGNTIHVIVCRAASDGNEVCGVVGGLAYYRSTDSGDTWELGADEGCIEGMNPDVFSTIFADAYSITAKGDVVAVVTGQYQPTLLKSTDGGDTWETRTIHDLGYTGDGPFDGSSGQELPLSVSTDGTYSVVIDDNDKVHVFYGRNLIEDDGSTDGTPYYPSNCAIMYWNEDLDDHQVIGKTVRWDEDGDSTAFFNFQESESCYSGTNLVSYPSAATDGNDIYLVYSAIVEGAHITRNLSMPDGQGGYTNKDANLYYRDVFVIKSTDGGESWIGPYNVTNNPEEEAVYACVAPEVKDGELHIVYQSDPEIGISVSGTVGANNDPCHATLENEVRYVTVNVDDIKDPENVNVTGPEISSPTARYGFENCPYHASLINLEYLDYPDGDTGYTIELGGDFVTGPADTEGYYPINVPGDTYTLDVTVFDSDGIPSTVTFGNPDEGNGMIIFADEAVPVIFPGPTQTIDGTIYTFFSLFDTMQITTDQKYEDPGAIVFDDEQITMPDHCVAELVVNNPLDSDPPYTEGWYEVSYTAVDINGNEAEPVTRYVQVIGEDTEAPELVLLNSPFTDTWPDLDIAEDGSTLSYGPIQVFWQDPGYLAFDNVDGDITDQVEVTIKDAGGNTLTEINLFEVTTYTVTYCVTDKAGNQTCATRNVEVEDTDPPVLILSGTNIKVWSDCIDYVDQGFESVYDEVDADVDASDVVTCGCVNPYCEGEYTLTFYVCDNAGNVATVERKVIVPPLGAGCEEDCTPCFNPCKEPIEDTCDIIIGIGVINPMPHLVQLYPNPTTGVLNIDLDMINTETDVSIYNVNGALISRFISQTGSAKVDMSDQANGVYMVKITTALGSTTQKVMLTK